MRRCRERCEKRKHSSMLLPILGVIRPREMDFDEALGARRISNQKKTFLAVSNMISTYPATITIGGSNYGQPADPSQALVDAGDGVFVPWTSNNYAQGQQG